MVTPIPEIDQPIAHRSDDRRQPDISECHQEAEQV